MRLQYSGHQAEVTLNPSARELWIRVRGPSPSNFFNLLQHTVNDRIIQRYFTGLVYERKIPCICHTLTNARMPCTHFFDYDQLVNRMRRGRLEDECDETLTMVPVPQLLEGIHYATQDRIEQRLDELNQRQQVILANTIQIQNLTEQVLRDTTRAWRFATNNISSDAPSTFVFMPGNRRKFNPRNLFDKEFTLYLLCQHPAGPHLVEKEEGYRLQLGHDWWQKVAPWLQELIKYLKYLPKAGGVLKAYDEDFYETIELNLEIFKTAVELVPELKEEITQRQFRDASTSMHTMEIEGAALRAFHMYLREVDPLQHWCGLRKVATNDGNILWLCDEHAKYHGI